jgi:hypothetical protein
MDYVKLLYRPLVARAARHVLIGRNRALQSPDRGRCDFRLGQPSEIPLPIAWMKPMPVYTPRSVRNYLRLRILRVEPPCEISHP